MINWTTNSHDSELIRKIAIKAHELAQERGIQTSVGEHMMDVTACHNTGELRDCFVPRYSAA